MLNLLLWPLESVTLALSIFITVMLLWLGLTVWLNGERGRFVVPLSASALLAAAIFFLSHTILLGLGFAETGGGMDFWWRLAWLPLPLLPYAWLLIVIRYAGLSPAQRAVYGRWQIALGVGCVVLIPIFILSNPFPSYASLVYAHAVNTDPWHWLAGAPLMLWLYLPYALMCYLLSLVALRAPAADDTLHKRARPWLAAISFTLLCVGCVVIATVLWVASHPEPLVTLAGRQRGILFSADLAVEFLIALALILLGRVIVGFEVLTERSLPRRGFFRQWRRTVIITAAFAIVVALVYRIQLRPIYSLMLTTALTATIFALFSWRVFAEHEEFLAALRPFVASTHLRERLLSSRTGDADIRALFDALCRDVLDAQHACLILDGSSGSPQQVGYRWFDSAEVTRTLTLDQERKPLDSARLLLGPKIGGGDYTAEEMDVARAAMQRIADLVAGEQVARLAMSLLRRRIAEVKVLSTQNRRVLHDDVLPQLHAAILRLEACGDAEAMAALTTAHKSLSAMVRQMGAAVPERLEREGLVVALRRALEHDFRDAFESVEWRVDESAARRITRDVPPFVAEVIFAAAQEAIRNAARHGRGDDGARPLRLILEMNWLAGLRLVVRDDGVGVAASNGQSNGGTGSGLLFHSTMLAVVGGWMRVESAAGRGTAVIIVVPEPALTGNPY
jgi:signal transduction histidine kinase